MKFLLSVFLMSTLIACNGGGGGGGKGTTTGGGAGGAAGGGGGGGGPLGTLNVTLVRSYSTADPANIATMGSFLSQDGKGFHFANGTVPLKDLTSVITGGAAYTTEARASYLDAPSLGGYKTHVSGTTISVIDRFNNTAQTLITADRTWPTGFFEIDTVPFGPKFAIYGRINAADAVSGLDEHYIILGDHGAVQIDRIPHMNPIGSTSGGLFNYNAGLYVTGSTLIYTTETGKIMSLDSTLTPVELMNNTWVAGKLIGSGNVFRGIANSTGTNTFTQVYEFTLSGGVLSKSPVGPAISLLVDGSGYITNSVPDLGYWDENFVGWIDSSNVFHLTTDYVTDVVTSAWTAYPSFIGEIGNFRYYSVRTDTTPYFIKFDKTLRTSQILQMPANAWAGGYTGAIFQQGGNIYAWMADNDNGQSVYLFRINAAFTTASTVWTSPTYTGYVYDIQLVNDNVLLVLESDDDDVLPGVWGGFHAYAFDGANVLEEPGVFTLPAGMTGYNSFALKPDGALVMSVQEGSDYVAYEFMADYTL